MSAASDNLRDNQEQADRDGTMVKVSRQAIDETLAELKQMRAALEPFAKYGSSLIGQQIRSDSAMLELWGNKVTVQNLRDAAVAMDGAYRPCSYAHMCRDGHVQIGHNDSEYEQCPLCRAMAALVEIKEFPESDDVSGKMAEEMASIAAHATRSIT